MYKVKEYEKTSVAAPSQWEGYLTDGREFYIRWRNDNFYFEIDGEEKLSYKDSEIRTEDYWAGVYMCTEEAFKICGLVVE